MTIEEVQKLIAEKKPWPPALVLTERDILLLILEAQLGVVRG